MSANAVKVGLDCARSATKISAKISDKFATGSDVSVQLARSRGVSFVWA